MDKGDVERVTQQLIRTSKAITALETANKVASVSINNLQYELKLIEQKLADMEARDKKLEKGGD